MNVLQRVLEVFPNIIQHTIPIGRHLLLSLVGRATDIAHVLAQILREGEYNPLNIVSLGLRRDGDYAHLIAFDAPPREVVVVNLPDVDLTRLFQRTCDYFSFISLMDLGLCTASIGHQCVPNHRHALSFFQLCQALFQQGCVIGDEVGSSTLLFLAPKEARILVAMRDGGSHLEEIYQPTGQIESRYALLDRATLLVAGHQTSDVYACRAEWIASALDETIMRWTRVSIDDALKIEDISLGIGHTGTVIVTAQENGTMKYFPAGTRWNRHRFEMCVSTRHGVEAYKDSPIVRVNPKTGRAVIVDSRTARPNRLWLSSFRAIGDNITQLISRIDAGTYVLTDDI